LGETSADDNRQLLFSSRAVDFDWNPAKTPMHLEVVLAKPEKSGLIIEISFSPDVFGRNRQAFLRR
jgi:hypothetical protein